MSIPLKYKQEILNEIEGLTEEQLSGVVKIIHIFKESIILQKKYDFGLKKEFDEWDNLSDEALIDFEKIL